MEKEKKGIFVFVFVRRVHTSEDAYHVIQIAVCVYF